MATKTVKRNTAKKGGYNLKSQVIKLHDKALATTDTLVEETLATGEEWQALFAKALKGGTKLFGQQQDILLNSLETFKGQYNTGTFRLKKLLAFKPFENNVKGEIKVATKKVANKVEAVAKKATADLNKLKTAPAKKTTAAKTPKTKNFATNKKAVSKTTDTDLTLIEGIGPKIAGLLNGAGIKNFEQLAAANKAELKSILDAAGARYRMHDPSTWAKQAKLAAAGKMAELKKLQAELKGGK
ncbi:MAG TPA: hypothetical protein ENJ95_13330 [Bacteroidetes bacterium]|nr:hypothetical protein [Bacteroidota bacterium]